MICHWAINRTDPQNLLSTTLDVPLHTPKKRKVYSLSREEREEVQAFVEDQLKKRYIRPSKSSQTSPVHFVAKKNRK